MGFDGLVAHTLRHQAATTALTYAQTVLQLPCNRSFTMRITVPFSPGYTFWSPRVLNRSELITITHEGKEYSRREETLQISAKQKEITRVEISLDKTGEPEFRYWGETVGKKNGWDALVDPHSGFTNEKDALDFARHWRATQCTEYFGGPVGEPGFENPADE